MDINVLKKLLDTVDDGGSAVLCTLVEAEGSAPRGAGASMAVFADGTSAGTIGGGAPEYDVINAALEMLRGGGDSELRRISLAEGSGGAVCGGSITVFLERYAPADEIVIFGAGHVGRAAARLARDAGFAVSVWDDRADLAVECAEFGRTISCPIDEAPSRLALHGKSCFIIIATRGHATDIDAAKIVLGRGCAYVGMVGSRRKKEYVREQLSSAGITSEQIDMLKLPIGLPIRAETPEEIAVSIMAEIIAVRRGANADAMRSGWMPSADDELQGGGSAVYGRKDEARLADYEAGRNA